MKPGGELWRDSPSSVTNVEAIYLSIGDAVDAKVLDTCSCPISVKSSENT